MIRVCLIDMPGAKFIKKLLGDFELVDQGTECDVVVSDRPLCTNVPVVIYNRQKDLKEEIVKASISGLYQPMHDSIDECLEITRQK